MGRILALDYGTKRIGVAISDEGQKIAFPKPFVPTEKKDEVLNMIAREAVEKILIGLPKSLSGKETKSTKAAREFADWLGQNSGAEIELIDERFTTRQAKEKLKDAGMKSKSQKTEIDSMSAYVLLEEYLRTEERMNE